jgi:hypothetical protein
MSVERKKKVEEAKEKRRKELRKKYFLLPEAEFKTILRDKLEASMPALCLQWETPRGTWKI